MNLYDIARRRDPGLIIERGAVTPDYRAGSQGFIGARLPPNTRARLVDVPSYSALRLGAELGWTVIEGDAEISKGPREIVLETRDGAVIKSGSYWSSRDRLMPFAVGAGVEVGPGANPHVRTPEVRYVENVTEEEWREQYHANGDLDWERYIIDDARTLDAVTDSAFIYSSHVFEHLMNPLGVLANWSRKLAPGGSVLAIIPDCRYCFDLRQTPSVLGDFEAEYAADEWRPGRAKFEKWCTGTQPNADPDALMQRGYSIHVHYYTPENFALLAQRAVDLGFYLGFDIWRDQNAKDFAVRLRAHGEAAEGPSDKATRY